MSFAFLTFLVAILGIGQIFAFAQSLNHIKVIPSIGIGEGLFSYNNKIDKNYIASYKTNYNPFAPTGIQFGLFSEITFKNSTTIGLGIANGISSYSYRIFMGRDEKIDTLPNGAIRKTITTTYRGKEHNRPTIKIPAYISFTIKSSNNTSKLDSIAFFSAYEKYKAHKIKIHTTFILGLSLIKLQNEDSYSDFDDYFENYANTDTIVFYSYHTYKNKWGGSFDIGLSINFNKNKKTLFRFNLRYEQGILPLFKQHLIYTRNNNIEYTNEIISRGSQVYFGFSFPLTVYKDK